MSRFFIAVGAVLLIYCCIWGYSWLEVWRDPKGELADFYARHPRTKAWVSLGNRLWVPALVGGLTFLIAGIMTRGNS
jgi:hypothetical protein